MAVLLLLAEEPMHPYGLRQRILEWDKDRVINVSQRYAIYQTVSRLQRSGLVTVQETTKRDNRPERIVFRATEEAGRLAHEWVRDMLRKPSVEYPDFPAALAFIASIPREEARDALRARFESIEESLAKFDKEVNARLAELAGPLDRIHLVDTDYQRAMMVAELDWLRNTLAELSGPPAGEELTKGV